MAYFLISYDLHKKRNYDLISEGIDKISHKVWVKVLESSYVIKSNLDSEKIRDFLNNFIDQDDSLFVIEVDIEDWASKGIASNLTNVLHHWNKS
ncbi:hypothetical protein [Acinetobacter modestus]|uniref:hypothetical protein n=1 Tax=Acinetobacter modestus TaxID=1776740 RepID=UPI003015BC5C